MSGRAILFGLAALVAAVPAAAQQRGTMEFGAFAGNTSFKNSHFMHSSWGAGGRVGMFIFPRLSAEVEAGGGKSSRDLGLQTVNQVSIAGRFTLVPVKLGRLSLLAGAGLAHTAFQVSETYGFQGLLGAKIAFSDRVALRIDGIKNWDSNPTNSGTKALHIGLSFYRAPRGLTTTVTREVAVAGPSVPQRPDSVSAYETGRLRGIAISYRELRDSLNRPKVIPPFVFRDTLVLEGVNFDFDSTAITPDSRDILNRVAAGLMDKEWVGSSWEIAGHTSSIGTHEYNMALSQRRAESVRAYLIARGVPEKRIFAKGYGETAPMYPNDSEGRNWRNRRVEMRRIKGEK